MNPRLLCVATAAPQHVVSQAEAKAVARGWFREQPAVLERVLDVFDHASLRERRLSRPASWYERPHDFAEKNATYCEVALDLMTQACERALERSGLSRDAFGSLVFASSTGVSTPSLDATLLQRLGLSRSIARVPLWGLGCAGGAAALGRAATLVRGTGRPALVVAAELCSLTFVSEDKSPANVVATAIFGDGVAAAVLAPDDERPGIELLGSHARVFDDTQYVMGWDVVAEGFKVRFAPSIAAIVRREAGRVFADACAHAGVDVTRLRHYVLHPGGPKVLEAFAETVPLTRDQVADAWTVLAEYGNMSGPTVFFVLERFLSRPHAPGELGVLTALGPGFAAESTVFRT